MIVIGHGGEKTKVTLGDNLRYAVQDELLGTGHAVQQAESLLVGQSDLILVLYGDMPLVRTQTLESLVKIQESNSGPMTLLTLQEDNPRGFGRIARDPSGMIKKIVEEVDANPEQLEIKELNAGMYCFKADWLWASLKKLVPSSSGEYYLTDLVELAASEGQQVASVQIEDPKELIGINTRVHLAETGQILRSRINQEWMLTGVSILDPSSTYIDPDVVIGQDTVILPNTYLQKDTTIGKNCIIGPGTRIFSSHLANKFTYGVHTALGT